MTDYNLIYRRYTNGKSIVAGVWFVGTTENIFGGDHHHILFSEEEINMINGLHEHDRERSTVQLAKAKLNK